MLPPIPRSRWFLANRLFALSILEDQANLPQPFSLEPNATGTGEWLNPSIYVFRPSVPLEGGQTYTAQIASFISTDGSNVRAVPMAIHHPVA
ncbi:MAG UNVERIFIED_CONTAM: hypothetical protein LVT10_08550 [Anaerolineae bacterium]